MITLKLTAVLLAVLFSDGALSKDPHCKYNVPSFCRLVLDAYTKNNDVLSLIKHYPNGATFDGDKERVEGVIQKIHVVLNTEKKSDLLAHLKMALDAETHTLFQLSVSCHGDKGKVAVCKTGLKNLCDAEFDLIYALGDVAEGEQRKAFQEAYKTVRARKYNESEICHQLYYDMGVAILNAIRS